ncbi:hypothetical protein SAY87_009240 [Trapa incisa]|uniref:Uncharacterized protein n=1 Tax=Trapa incisa TaxID=236973 RepID=A0AAN7K1D6_9MYRT|nr:hypothetical protein SAY87_009240 [Trapa incisa]
MALFKWMPRLVFLLVLLPASLAFGWNWDHPFNATNACDGVQCGKGKCVPDTGYPYAFVCQCDSGWKRTRLDNEDALKFLPCVIPSCSVQYSCMPAPAPLPPVPYNTSFFDPCYWSYCGGGTCIKSSSSSSPHDRICQCDPGYTNLMNVSVFPCFNDCAIGSDCSKLGIKVADSTSTPGSSSASDSYAHTSLPGKLLWATVLGTSMALALWK